MEAGKAFYTPQETINHLEPYLSVRGVYITFFESVDDILREFDTLPDLSALTLETVPAEIQRAEAMQQRLFTLRRSLEDDGYCVPLLWRAAGTVCNLFQERGNQVREREGTLQAASTAAVTTEIADLEARLKELRGE